MERDRAGAAIRERCRGAIERLGLAHPLVVGGGSAVPGPLRPGSLLRVEPAVARAGARAVLCAVVDSRWGTASVGRRVASAGRARSARPCSSAGVMTYPVLPMSVLHRSPAWHGQRVTPIGGAAF